MNSVVPIDPVTGIITTKARLDRESKSSYSLILVARDQGNPFQQATRKLQVVVRDIDDHPPQFIRTPVIELAAELHSTDSILYLYT